jgi:hypothetical protein
MPRPSLDKMALKMGALQFYSVKPSVKCRITQDHRPVKSSYLESGYTYSVESIVDEMLEILAHPDLSHQLVLVPVHTRQLTHMRKDVLETIGKLK